MTLLGPNPEPPPPPEAPTPKVRPRMPVSLPLLALGLILLAALTSPFWGPRAARLLPWGPRPLTAAAPGDAAIHALQLRLDADEAELKQQAARLLRLPHIEDAVRGQETRLSRLETRPAAPAASTSPPAGAPGEGAPGAARKTLEDQIDKLAANAGATGDRLARLEASLKTGLAAASPPAATAAASPTAALKTLADRIDKLKAGDSATSDRVARLEASFKSAFAADSAHRARLIALANLRIAAQGGGPFAAELAAAQTLSGDDVAMKDALLTLGDSARSGLPTTAALAERFDHSVAPAILRSPGDDPNAGWWQQMRARLGQLVVVRRIGPGAASPRDAAEAAVTKADAALRAGDLAAAVAALDALPGQAAKAAAPWLARARQRLTAETTLATLWRDETARSSTPHSGTSP